MYLRILIGFGLVAVLGGLAVAGLLVCPACPAWLSCLVFPLSRPPTPP